MLHKITSSHRDEPHSIVDVPLRRLRISPAEKDSKFVASSRALLPQKACVSAGLSISAQRRRRSGMKPEAASDASSEVSLQRLQIEIAKRLRAKQAAVIFEKFGGRGI